MRPGENPYAYCGADPVNRIDPTGLFWYQYKDEKPIWKDQDYGQTVTSQGKTYQRKDEVYYTDKYGRQFYGDNSLSELALMLPEATVDPNNSFVDYATELMAIHIANQNSQAVFQTEDITKILEVSNTSSGAAGLIATGLEAGWKASSNASQWSSAKTIANSLKDTGFKIQPRAIKNGMPKILKGSGNIVGGIGIGITILQLANNDISGVEAGVDIAFGVIGFMGPIGAGVSTAYFLGKIAYEEISGETLFTKPL